MYTQCAQCETVFRLSAEVLRAAGGQVRCGRCGEVFNALARLAEDASSFPDGESALELETRADEILHSMIPPVTATLAPEEESEDLDAADIEFARLQVLDSVDDDAQDVAPAPIPPARRSDSAKAAEAAKAAASLKLAAAAHAASALRTAASKALAAKSSEAPRSGSAADSADVRKSAPAPGAPSVPTPLPRALGSADAQDDGSLEFTLPPGELDRIFVEAAPRSAESVVPTPLAQRTESTRDGAAPGSVPGLEVSEEIRREMLQGMGEEQLLPQLQTPVHRPLPFALWFGMALVLALLLAAQMIHANRGWLAAHSAGPLRGLYAALAIAPQAAVSLSSYQLRQWGVTGDPSASGTLRVRASILNTSPQLQPYPLLRVTLANRFGTRIGARDFEPAEYMGKPIVRMLAPGERADATLDIVDPGKDAEGFEIDVCMRNGEQTISCAGDAAARPAPAQSKP